MGIEFVRLLRRNVIVFLVIFKNAKQSWVVDEMNELCEWKCSFRECLSQILISTRSWKQLRAKIDLFGITCLFLFKVFCQSGLKLFIVSDKILEENG